MNTTEQPQIYLPDGCLSMDSTTLPQVRLGLQGFPKSGKTIAAAGFPNPLFVNFDRGLGSLTGKAGIKEFPMYDPKTVDKLIPRSGANNQPNRRDAYLKLLHDYLGKMGKNQTLVTDGLTGIQNAYHSEVKASPYVTKDGRDQGYAEWKFKNAYFADLVTEWKALTCDVILICHQMENSLKGGYRPLLSGGFADELESHFTDWFRTLAIEKPAKDNRSAFKDKWLIKDDTTLNEWIASTPDTHNTIYLWQTQADSIAECGTSSLVNAPKYILASYSSFSKYRVKPQLAVEQKAA